MSEEYGYYNRYNDDSYEKYHNFIKTINSNFSYEIIYNKEIIDEIIAFNDVEKVSQYSSAKWAELFSLFVKSDINELSFGLLAKMVQSEYMPQEFFTDFIDYVDVNCLDILLTSEYVPDCVIAEIINLIPNFPDILYRNGYNFSQNVFEYLIVTLEYEDMKKLNFLPFMFLTLDTATEMKLFDILDGKKNLYYDSELDDNFTSAICANENLFDEIRNKAFDMGYNPSIIQNYTKHMIEEIYKTYADVIFEITPIDNDEIGVVFKAQEILFKLSYRNLLPESCQIDFVSRYKDNCIEQAERVLEAILYNTTSDAVLQETLNTTEKVFSMLLKNKFGGLTEEICKKDNEMKKTIVKNGLSKLYKPFMFSVFERKFSPDTLKYFSSRGIYYVPEAIMLSNKISEKDEHDLLSNSLCEEDYLHLDLLRKLKHTLNEVFDNPNKEKILMFAENEFLKQEKISDAYDKPEIKCREYLSEKINNYRPYKWYPIKENEYQKLKTKISEFKEEYSSIDKPINLIKMLESVEKRLDKVYEASKLSEKYPDIFITNYDLSTPTTTDTLHCVPYDEIDVEKLLSLSDEKLKELMEDVKRYSNPNICNNITRTIITHCNASYDFYTQYKIAEMLYKLNDFFNVCCEYGKIKIKESELELEEIEPNQEISK